MWLVAMSRCAVRSGCVMWWIWRWSGDPYYKVLQSTTPYSKILQSTTLYYKALLCTTQYYKVLQSIIPFHSPTHETPSTMREATGGTLELHQILRTPRKMILMIDPCLTTNIKYNAGSSRHHPPTSPNIVPATKNDCHDWSSSNMKRHLQCAEQQASPSNLTKYCTCHENDSHDWSASHMKHHLQCAEQQESASNFTKYCACHANESHD